MCTGDFEHEGSGRSEFLTVLTIQLTVVLMWHHAAWYKCLF
jgi:hypothetical protein